MVGDDLVRELWFAVRNGDFILRMDNFKGWQEDCDCRHCTSQKKIFEYIQNIAHSIPMSTKMERTHE